MQPQQAHRNAGRGSGQVKETVPPRDHLPTLLFLVPQLVMTKPRPLVLPSTKSTHDDELATYRALLASMANTCRTLQTRIRNLEMELVTRQLLAEAERLHYTPGVRSPLRSPLSPTNPSGGWCPLGSESSRGGLGPRRKYSRDASRRHSAPPGSLHCPETVDERDELDRENEGEVWVLYDETELFLKSWQWY